MTWTVGQQIVEVTPTYARPPKHNVREAVITKIGKRWAYYSVNGRPQGRFDIDDSEIDGGEYSGAGYCYPSLAAWEDAQDRKLALDELRQLIGYSDHRISPALKAADVRAFIALAKEPDE